MRLFEISVLVCCLSVFVLVSCGSDEKGTIENGDLSFTYNRNRHNIDLLGFSARMRIQKSHVQFTTEEGVLDMGDGDFQHAFDQGRFDNAHGKGEYLTVSFTDPWQRHDGGTTYRVYDEGRRFSIESRITNASRDDLTIFNIQMLKAYPDLGGGVTVGAEAATVSALVQGPGQKPGGNLPFAEMANRRGLNSWQSLALVQPERQYTILMGHVGRPRLHFHVSLKQPADKKIGPPLSVIVTAAFQDPAGSDDPHEKVSFEPITIAPGNTITTGELMIQFLDHAVDDLESAVGQLLK